MDTNHYRMIFLLQLLLRSERCHYYPIYHKRSVNDQIRNTYMYDPRIDHESIT